MLELIDGREQSTPVFIPRPHPVVGAADPGETVRGIIDEVRLKGDEALIELTERFDGVRLADLAVPADALEQALADLDPAVRAALDADELDFTLVTGPARMTLDSTSGLLQWSPQTADIEDSSFSLTVQTDTGLYWVVRRGDAVRDLDLTTTRPASKAEACTPDCLIPTNPALRSAGTNWAMA